MPRAPDASRLSVVIPTINRWETLRRTLDGLRGQTLQGFEIVVVADGNDKPLPDLPGVRLSAIRHSGPGAARNAGVALARGDLILLLGDDMVPDPGLVEAHLLVHAAQPDEHVVVLGYVDWHQEVRRTAALRWLDRSRTQFNYASLRDFAGRDVGFGHFYSCNVSFKRSLFERAGGFDPDFLFHYEDLDLGYRLGELGMQLIYEPVATARHLHSYDWAAVQRRFQGIALGERIMAGKHAWFEPWFRRRLADADRATLPVPPALVDLVPARVGWVREHLQRHADRHVDRRLRPVFESAWTGADGIVELHDYLGDAFDPQLVLHHAAEVDREAESADDELTFYRTSNVYLYDLTMFAAWGTKDPYFKLMLRHVPPGGHILDYGCGIGTDGIRLIERGYRVAFADFDNPSVEYLRWRLKRRGITAEIYDVEHDEIPAGFDAAYSFDVIEHVDDPVAYLERLEQRAAVVAVNLLAPEPGDTHLHHDLPIALLRDRAARQGLLVYRLLHGRSHLLIYRTAAERSTPTLLSRAALWRGHAETAARGLRARVS